jgi:hypothetical protein
MKMGKSAKRTRMGIAGIVATVIMFAILFTVGTSYFIFVNQSNADYVKNLVSASGKMQGSLGESLTVTTTLLSSSGDIGYYVNNTSGRSMNITTALLVSSTGQVLKCVGNGLPAGSCSSQSPTFTVCTNSTCSATQSQAYIVVNAGRGSSSIDTGYLPVSGFTYTLKVITALGNIFTQTYPQTSDAYSNQANSASVINIDLNSLRWIHLIGQTSTFVQKAFNANCNSSSCGKAFASSVTAGNILVLGLGWYNHAPPTSISDTRGDDFTLGVSNSVASSAIAPALVQKAYLANCNSNSCGTSFASSVTAGDTLVYGVGWYKNSPPSTPTDTLGNSYSLAASQSVVAGGIPSLVQDSFNANCGSANCGQAFSSSVTANNVLVYAVGWSDQGSSPSLAGSANEKYCSNSSSCNAGKVSGVIAGNMVALAIGWYGQTAPTSITDSFSDTFVLGISNSVVVSGTTYYSAVYYATANGSGDDTMVANFSGNANIAETPYELSGVSSASLSTSVGSSTTGTTTAQVSSFTPAANSFIIAVVQTGGNAGGFTQGSGYTFIGGPAPCNGGSTSVCSEYDASSLGAQTAPMTLSNSVGFTEAAIAFPGITGSASPPSTPTDTLGNTFTLAASSSLGSTPSLPNSKNEKFCTGQNSCQNTVNGVTVGDVVAVTLGWYDASAPTVTDGFGDTFTSGASISKSNSGSTWYSAVYYTVATESGNDAVTASFGSSINSAMTLYDVSGVSTSGISSSTNWSTSGTQTAQVSSFTPTAGSFVIANVQTMADSGGFSQGSGYTVPGGSGSCNGGPGGPRNVCSEYDASSSGAQTAPFTLTNYVGYVEAAVAFPSIPSYYNSYIWCANSGSSGADTITAQFSASVAGSVSIYEVNGVTVSGVQSSTGSSSTGPHTASVNSFTPTTNAFVVGNVEVGSTPSFSAGSTYALVSSNCNNNWGCSEYNNDVTSATTVQMSTNVNVWDEAAIALTPSNLTWYSYVWYATAGSSGADTISASFSTTTVGSVSIYEISGAVTAGLLTSTGSSASSSSTGSVTSFTVNPGSFMVVNTETVGGTTFTGGSGYTLSGSCSGVYGCGEYQTGISGAHTATINLSPSSPYVEVAVNFAPTTVNYYSYIYYATALSTGSDTINATFSSSVSGTVSIYELNGFTTSGYTSSVGNSSASSTSASVSSFTPASGSIVIANVESAIATENSAAGSGFTLVGSGCSSAYGCGEYQTGISTPSTAPFTLGTASPWVESAISFSVPINPQSGIQVGGYPTMGIPPSWAIVFRATFTNLDPLQRSVTLWPESVLTLTSIPSTGQPESSIFYIIDGVNTQATSVVAYSSTNGSFLTLPYNVPTTIYFGSSTPLGSASVSVDPGPQSANNPFTTFFSLSGEFSNNKLYGVTIPFPYGLLAGANAYTTTTAGNTGSQVTVTCQSPCSFVHSAKGFVAWIDSYGTLTKVANFTTTAQGNLPANLTFTVPSAPAGYYTLMVSDYADNVFMTYQHT